MPPEKKYPIKGFTLLAKANRVYKRNDNDNFKPGLESYVK